MPETLDEITVVVVPMDPMYQKPFEYRVEGDKAILTMPPREGKDRKRDSYLFEMRMKE